MDNQIMCLDIRQAIRFMKQFPSYGFVRRDIIVEGDFRGVNLSFAHLKGANLYRANLSYANLSYAILYGASLTGANLSFATLTGANLSHANLHGAWLKDANLEDVSLIGANTYLMKC